MAVLTYNELHRVISESIASVIEETLLTESQESKSISEAIKLYMERTGESYEKANEVVRFSLRGDIPALRSKEGGKFILGVMRMFLDGQLKDATSISKMNTTLKYVAGPTHINQYDRNLNGLSAQELIEKFAPVARQDLEKSKSAMSKQQFNARSEYRIIPINSFDEIRPYGEYNDWCLAQNNGEEAYMQYTANEVNQLYLILRNGFENEPRQAGPDTPYDSYGLSMMTVIVDPDGHMTQSTTRWNHENGSTDHAFTPESISKVIGRNFYDVFKPNEEIVRAADDVKKVFEDESCIIMRPLTRSALKYWMSKKNEEIEYWLSDTPFKGDNYGKCILIFSKQLKMTFIIMPEEGQWDCMDYLFYSYANSDVFIRYEDYKDFIRISPKASAVLDNMIIQMGRSKLQGLIMAMNPKKYMEAGVGVKDIFEEVEELSPERVMVEMFGSRQLVDLNTKTYVLNKWMTDIRRGNNCMLLSSYGTDAALINRQGEVMDVYDAMDYTMEKSLIIVKKDMKANILDLKTGGYISEKWYYDFKVLKSGLFKVMEEINNEWKYNIINTDGKLLLNEWANNIRTVTNAIIEIEYDRTDDTGWRTESYYLMDGKGVIVNDEPYDSVMETRVMDMILVSRGNKYCLLKSTGKPTDYGWFDSYGWTGDYSMRFAMILYKDKKTKVNLLGKDGIIMYVEWPEVVKELGDNKLLIELHGMYNVIYKYTGALLLPMWSDEVIDIDSSGGTFIMNGKKKKVEFK